MRMMMMLDNTAARQGDEHAVLLCPFNSGVELLQMLEENP